MEWPVLPHIRLSLRARFLFSLRRGPTPSQGPILYIPHPNSISGSSFGHLQSPGFSKGLGYLLRDLHADNLIEGLLSSSSASQR
jgi:hypothetical protein